MFKLTILPTDTLKWTKTLLLFIDNYDSFTYNLVQYFEQLGQTVVVWHNDAHTIDAVWLLNPQYVVIGPGPCTPTQAGISLDLIKSCGNTIPILGVCLGHQAIGQAFGAKIVGSDCIMHGRVSAVMHNNQGVFSQLPSPFRATRYHSLVIEPDSLPDCLQITAWTAQQQHASNTATLMGIKHKHLPIEGVQFHPESILSEHGLALLNNFLQQYGDVNL